MFFEENLRIFQLATWLFFLFWFSGHVIKSPIFWLPKYHIPFFSSTQKNKTLQEDHSSRLTHLKPLWKPLKTYYILLLWCSFFDINKDWITLSKDLPYILTSIKNIYISLVCKNVPIGYHYVTTKWTFFKCITYSILQWEGRQQEKW